MLRHDNQGFRIAMNRRGLMGGLALLLLPGAAAAQMQAAPMQPRGAAAPRQRVADQSWDQIAPRKRRKIQERLAGAGNPPMPPDQARQMWDGMTPAQRRQATRRQPGEPRQARARRPQDGSMPPPPGGPMTQ